jgi:putative transposase
LKIFADQCRRHHVAILGYCLMTNHVHQVVIPATAEGLARAIGRTHWLYTQYVNRLHRRSGHLWQNRFYSAPLEDESCLLAVRYTERNPLRAKMCRVARRYPWSSAAAHCSGKDPTGILDMQRWKELSAGIAWENELALPLTAADLQRIRRATHTGRPLASDRALAKLEALLGRRLRALPIGRPRRQRTPRKGRQK